MREDKAACVAVSDVPKKKTTKKEKMHAPASAPLFQRYA